MYNVISGEVFEFKYDDVFKMTITLFGRQGDRIPTESLVEKLLSTCMLCENVKDSIRELSLLDLAYWLHHNEFPRWAAAHDKELFPTREIVRKALKAIVSAENDQKLFPLELYFDG